MKNKSIYQPRLKVSKQFGIDYFDHWVQICIKNFFQPSVPIPVKFHIDKDLKRQYIYNSFYCSYFPTYKDYINIPKSVDNSYKSYSVNTPTSSKRFKCFIKGVKDLDGNDIPLSLCFFRNGHFILTKYGYLALIAQNLKLDLKLLSSNQLLKISKAKKRFDDSGILAVDVVFNSFVKMKQIFAMPVDFYSRFKNYFFKEYYFKYSYKSYDTWCPLTEYQKTLKLNLR